MAGLFLFEKKTAAIYHSLFDTVIKNKQSMLTILRVYLSKIDLNWAGTNLAERKGL